MTASIVGQRALPVKPARMQATSAREGTGRKDPARNSAVDSAHPQPIARKGSSRAPAAPTAIRPNAIISEKSSRLDPPIHAGKPRDFSA